MHESASDSDIDTADLRRKDRKSDLRKAEERESQTKGTYLGSAVREVDFKTSLLLPAAGCVPARTAPHRTTACCHLPRTFLHSDNLPRLAGNFQSYGCINLKVTASHFLHLIAPPFPAIPF